MDESNEGGTGSPGPAGHSAHLLEVVVRALPAWVEATVRRSLRTVSPIDEETVRAEIAATSRAMVEGARASLTELLALDPDRQRANPLHVLRDRASVVTECLRRLGARPAVRDEFERTALPDDVFGVGPLTWRDLGDEVHEAGITWGAWKAATIMSRHRSEGTDR